jgi:hypothetical protein
MQECLYALVGRQKRTDNEPTTQKFNVWRYLAVRWSSHDYLFKASYKRYINPALPIHLLPQVYIWA